MLSVSRMDCDASAGSVDAVEAGVCAQISKADITKAIIDFDRLDFAKTVMLSPNLRWCRAAICTWKAAIRAIRLVNNALISYCS